MTCISFGKRGILTTAELSDCSMGHILYLHGEIYI